MIVPTFRGRKKTGAWTFSLWDTRRKFNRAMVRVEFDWKRWGYATRVGLELSLWGKRPA